MLHFNAGRKPDVSNEVSSDAALCLRSAHRISIMRVHSNGVHWTHVKGD